MLKDNRGVITEFEEQQIERGSFSSAPTTNLGVESATPTNLSKPASFNKGSAGFHDAVLYTKSAKRYKMLVYIVILCTAAIMGVTAYRVLEKQETKDYENEVSTPRSTPET